MKPDLKHMESFEMDVEAEPLVEPKPLGFKTSLKEKFNKYKSWIELPVAAGAIVGWDFCKYFAICNISVVHNAWCGLMFQCGCTWDFHGGWNDCNIHKETGLL